MSTVATAVTVPAATKMNVENLPLVVMPVTITMMTVTPSDEFDNTGFAI